MCGAFSGFVPSLPHPLLSTVYQCDGCLSYLGRGAYGWVVRFCQPLVRSPSWSLLPIVVAPGCLGHPTSTVSVRATKLFIVIDVTPTPSGWLCTTNILV